MVDLFDHCIRREVGRVFRRLFWVFRGMMYVIQRVGLRKLNLISDECAENEKQQEMEIGFPTDVKHVAHIGWDGPSVTSPSWVFFFFLTVFHDRSGGRTASSS